MNALTVNTQIGIQIGPVPETVDPLQVTIPRAFTFRPHGLLFANSKVATANVFYIDSEVLGVDERLLKSWVWNSQTNSWESRANRNTPSQNKISIDLTGFSLYGISAPIVNTTWISPNLNQIVKKGTLLSEFKLNYADGNEIFPIQSADELQVKLKNELGQILLTNQFEPSGILLDEDTRIYKVALHFTKNGIPDGNYILEVYLAGNFVGSQNFSIAR